MESELAPDWICSWLTRQERYASESARLQEEMRTRLEKFEDLANLLATHAGAVAGAITGKYRSFSSLKLMLSIGSTPDKSEDEFDKLLSTKDLGSLLRSLSSAQIVSLAQYAQTRMLEELNEGQGEVEAELQVRFD